jgi:hypothetical protein
LLPSTFVVLGFAYFAIILSELKNDTASIGERIAS